jgi:hypothetical protein
VTVVGLRNEGRDTELGSKIRVADSWWPRLRGMIGHPPPAEGEGLLLAPCSGVHMHWMKYALDILFLDGEDRVVAVYDELRPWRFSKTHKDAVCAVELPVGTLRRTGTRIGDRVSRQTERQAAA